MPIIINEIVIKTNVEQPVANSESGASQALSSVSKAEIVQEAVAKVLEKLKEKQER